MAELWRQADDLHARLVPDYFRSAARTYVDWIRVLEAPLCRVLVEERQQQGLPPVVVGVVSIRIFDTPDDPSMRPRRRGHVDTLVVDRNHRRVGIGTALMKAARSWAQEHGAAELVLTVWAGNQDADAFYQRLGYTVLSRVLRKNVSG